MSTSASSRQMAKVWRNIWGVMCRSVAAASLMAFFFWCAVRASLHSLYMTVSCVSIVCRGIALGRVTGLRNFRCILLNGFLSMMARYYPRQIAILKERISGMTEDIQTAKANLPADKEQFMMKVGDKVYTDKKEAGTALVEMCKEMKTVNVPATVGEYAGFKMAVSFDSFNHKFVMNLKGQISHNLEIGSDPLGNISRINHALESMPKQLAEAQTKLENVERQLETAKTEVEKPFAQEAELAEKLERLAVLNALLNMDEKGDDAIGMDDEPGEESGERGKGNFRSAGSRDAETGGNKRKTERGGHINFKNILLQKRRKHHKI